MRERDVEKEMRPSRLTPKEPETGRGAQLSWLPGAADIAALADPAPECWAFLLPLCHRASATSQHCAVDPPRAIGSGSRPPCRPRTSHHRMEAEAQLRGRARLQGLSPVSTEEKDIFGDELAFRTVADGQQGDSDVTGHGANLRLPARDPSARGSRNDCSKGRSEKPLSAAYGVRMTGKGGHEP
jgi:hypothetical protein